MQALIFHDKQEFIGIQPTMKLPCRELWVIVAGAGSLTQCLSLRFHDFDLRVTGSLVTKLGT